MSETRFTDEELARICGACGKSFGRHFPPDDECPVKVWTRFTPVPATPAPTPDPLEADFPEGKGFTDADAAALAQHVKTFRSPPVPEDREEAPAHPEAYNGEPAFFVRDGVGVSIEYVESLRGVLGIPKGISLLEAVRSMRAAQDQQAARFVEVSTSLVALEADAAKWRAHAARKFPIMDGPAIPWTGIEPFEYMAQKNHGQTLERLAERGGLSVLEALHIIKGARWHTDAESRGICAMSKSDAVRELQRLTSAALPDHGHTDG